MSRLFFLYHELRAEPSQYSYVVSPAEFEAHCRFYRQVSESRFEGMLCPEVSFDDGNLSDYRYALPLLQASDRKAHFFITAGWTGTRAGFMTASELRALHGSGMTVGAHGWSHKLLTACTQVELQTELTIAKKHLEDILGSSISAMSLPGGRANGRVLRACSEAGYTSVFTSEPRASDAAPNSAPAFVGRLNLRGGTTTTRLEQILRPDSKTLARLQRSHRLKDLAKNVLGDKLYAAAWALANRQEPDPADAGQPGAPA